MERRIRIIVILVLLLVLIRGTLVIGYVPSASMAPTIPSGSLIVGSRMYSDIQKGDIIIFQHQGRLLVKRVWGVPGDIISSAEIIFDMDVPKPKWAAADITVPAGCFFVLGDNSEHSIDSRYWEDPFVMETQILAVVIFQ